MGLRPPPVCSSTVLPASLPSTDMRARQRVATRLTWARGSQRPATGARQALRAWRRPESAFRRCSRSGLTAPRTPLFGCRAAAARRRNMTLREFCIGSCEVLHARPGSARRADKKQAVSYLPLSHYSRRGRRRGHRGRRTRQSRGRLECAVNPSRTSEQVFDSPAGAAPRSGPKAGLST